MSNPFDQFDSSSASANPFDQFDTEPPKKSSTLRKAADIPLGIAGGAIGATKALSDAFGANNVVSRGLEGAGDGVNSMLTPEAKAAQRRQGEILDEAKRKGIGEQVGAAGRAFMEAPLQTTAQGLGSVVPFLATAAIPGALPARLAAGAMGAGMGAGTAKGSISEEITKRELAAGKTPEQAAAAADAAQSYTGANADQIALGAGLGVADAAFGVAPAAVGLLRKNLGKEVADQTFGKAGEGILKAGLKGAAKEAPVEFLQGGQEQVAANIAAQRAGYEAGTFDGAFSQGTLEALASAGPGAGFGIYGRSAAQPANTPPPEQPPAAPATQPATPPAAGPVPPSADATAIGQEQIGGLQRTFDPRAGVEPPLSLTPKQDGGIPYDAPAPKPFGQNFMMQGEPVVERPSVTMGLNPDFGPLSGAAALAVDSGASPAVQGFGLMRRPADFVDVEPITSAAGQIGTPRRLGESPVIDVQAREVRGPELQNQQARIGTTPRIGFNQQGAISGTQAQEAIAPESGPQETPAAGLTQAARQRNLETLKARMMAGRATGAVNAQAAPVQPASPTADAGPAPVDAGAEGAQGGLGGTGAVDVAGQPEQAQALSARDSRKLQEAHKALGYGVTQPQVQSMRDRVAKEVETGTTNNGGVVVALKPAAINERREQLKRLDADLALFGSKPSEPAAEQLPPTDIRLGDKVMVDGKPFTVYQGVDGGIAVESDTADLGNGVSNSETRILKGDDAIRAKIAADKAGLNASPATVKESLTAEPVAKPATSAIGRNGTPLAEGGKPFKSKAEADAYRKLQPQLRSKKEGKGYVLVEKTPAQISAQANAARRLGGVGAKGKPLAAHEFLASDGGLSLSTMADLGFDKNVRIGAKWLFTRTGKTFEGMTEALQQNGYMDGTEQNTAIDLVKRSAKGQPQYTAEGWSRIAEAETTSRFEDHLAAQQEAAQDSEDSDIDPWELAPSVMDDFVGDDLAVAGYDASLDPIKREVNALLAQLEAAGVDTETLREDVAREAADLSEQEYYERLKARAISALAETTGSRSAGANRQDAGERPGQEAQRGSGADSREGNGSEGAQGTDSEAAGLTAPTQADIEAQQDRATKAEREAKAKKQADDERARIDRERKDIAQASVAAADTFELGQDPMANLTGQQDVFGEPARQPAAAPENGVQKGGRPLTAEEKEVNRIDGDAQEFGMTIEQESAEADFDPAEIPAALDQWIKQYDLPAEQFTKAVIANIEKRQFRRKAGVLAALKKTVTPAPAEAPKLTQAEAADLMEWQNMGQTDNVQKHTLFFYESKADKEAKRGRMTVATITKGDRSATGWMVDGDDQKFGPLALAKKRGMVIGMAKAKSDGFVVAGEVAAKPEPKKAEAKPAEAAKPIADAGQKIGGARKDRWKERGLNMADLDSMTESEGAELATKANVWKPDYDALAEQADQVTAATVKVIYDRLAAKPAKNTPAGRRQYVEAMQAVRRVYGGLTSAEDLKNARMNLLYGELKWTEGRAGDNAWAARNAQGIDDLAAHMKAAKEKLFAVYKGRSDPFTIGYNELQKIKKMVADGFPAKGEPWKTRLTVSTRKEGGQGATEAGIQIYMDLSAEVGTPLTREQVEAGFYRVRDKQNKTVAFAPTREDAEAAAKTVYERDMKGGKDGKPEPERPHLDELKRENLPNRIDRDVTADDFVKDLGFRGIEFGNWSAQDERQRILNMAYDGLMDLAEIMGVPPKAMSLNGTLGMAFGARGGGRFAAHYEPGKLVINMTKIRGGGSMAHEWAHAMDHYFGELNKADAYTTKARGASGWDSEDQYQGIPRKRMEQVGGEWKNVEKLRLDNLRPELARAFDGVMLALFQDQVTKAEMVRSSELDLERTQALAMAEKDPAMKAMYQRMAENKQQALNELRQDPEGTMYANRGRSQYAKEAQALSGKSVNGYWVRPTEMFARAFESWVFDRVTAMGAKSDYLVHGVEADRFAGGDYKGNPYPTGEERARINAAFDKLAQTIKTKEGDDGKVVMFSRASETKAARAALARIMENGVTSPDDLRALLRVPGYSKLAKSTIAGDMAGAKALRGEIEKTFPGNDWRGPTLNDQGIISIYPDWGALTDSNLQKLTALADKYDAPIAMRGGAVYPGSGLDARMSGHGFERYNGLQERADRLPGVMFGMIRPAGGITATTPLFSQTPASPRTPASTIRQAITKAYGNLLSRLEGKGLVTLTQTEEQAIAAAAQARADQNGGDVEAIKQSLRKSVLASQRAWHGTPHRGIEKFSTDKIGTGEGAQAFGWGLYFADRRELGEHYRQKLTGHTKDLVAFNGKQFHGNSKSEMIDFAIEVQNVAGLSEKARDTLAVLAMKHRGDMFAVNDDLGVRMFDDSPDAAIVEVYDWINSVDQLNPPAGGQLYEVEIPNDTDMLLWDKPLSEQPESVREALANAYKGRFGSKGRMSYSDALEYVSNERGQTGEDAYKETSKRFADDFENGNDKAASEYLASLGIKGIKYLDGTSRNAGEGSYNYVVFSGDDVQIVDVKYSKDGNLEGFFDPATGKSFLIADNLTAESAPGTLMHEVGIHMAADGKLEPLFTRAAQLLKLGKNNPFLQRVQARMDQSGETSAEEAAAYIVTEYENDRANAPASVTQWVKDFIAQVRAWLFKNGMMLKADQLTVADIAAVARANAKSMAVGDSQGEVRNSKQATPDKRESQIESENFKRWFGGSRVVDTDGRPLVSRSGLVLARKAAMSEGRPDGDTSNAKPLADLLVSKAFGLEGLGGLEVPSQRKVLDGVIALGDDLKVLRSIVELIPVDVMNILARKNVAPEMLFSDKAMLKELLSIDGNGSVSTAVNVADALVVAVARMATERSPIDASMATSNGENNSASNAGVSDDFHGRIVDRIKPTGNNGNFDPASPDIRRSRSAGNTSPTGAQGASWHAPIDSKWDDYVFQLQDKHIDLKRVTQAITKWSGKLADDINVYLQEELYHGRTAKRVQDFTRMELEPALKQLARQGFQLADLEEFMHARHAKEANRVIAERNPTQDMIDAAREAATLEVDRLQAEYDAAPAGQKKAAKAALKAAKDERKRWRSASAFKGTEDERQMLSGMSNAAADAYMASLTPGDKLKLAAAAAKFDAIMNETSRLMVEYELESQDTIDSWAMLYQHYVPLQREDKEGGGRGIGQGFSVKGRETKGRTGSTRKVVDIIANIAAAREKTVVRGEKNRVSQALVGLVSAHPNQDFWKVGPPDYERVFNPNTGKVENRVSPTYKSLPNVVVAKVAKGGVVKEVAITFNEDDARAVRMAAALKNLDTPQIEGWLGTVSKMTRYFASINTQYNPVFGVVNLVRDVQGAMINLGATELADQKSKVAKDAIRALAGIYKDIRATRNGGAASSAWSKLYEQFQHDGGQTGFRDLFTTPADRTESLKNVIDPEAWANSGMGKFFSADGKLTQPLTKARGGFGVVFNWLSDYNEAMENGVRLAAYKAALDKGMTRQQAASLAKSLTVNFNRKGLSGTQAGAVYAFFNAAMQGTARIGETLMTMEPGQPKTLRLTPFGKKVVYGGVLLGSVQALALAAAGFDDDEPPEFVRERSLIIPTGGKTYVSIPMPLGLHVIPNIGRVATEFTLGGFKNPAQRVAELGGLFADAFNPIGNAGLSMQTIAPTVLDPLVALTENKDWTGKPIARVSSNKDLPGYTQYKDSASVVSKFLAEAINTLSGGNQYVAGVLSPTPDQIDYLAGQLGGGVWREISKVEQTTTNTITGEEVPLYKVPLLGRFVGSAAGQAGEGNAFYSNANKLNRLETELKGLVKDGKLEEARALRADNPEARLIIGFNMAERQVQKLRREKRALVESGADTAQVKAMDERITTIMRNMNQMMATAEGSAQTQ